MFYISPVLTGYVLVLMVVAGAVIGGLGSRLRRQSGEAQGRLGALVSNLEETLGGLRVIKGFNAERFQSGRFAVENDLYRDILIKIHRRRDLASPMSEFLGIGIFVVLLFIGSRQVFFGEMSAETFITFLYAFFSVIDPAKNLSAVVMTTASLHHPSRLRLKTRQPMPPISSTPARRPKWSSAA